MMEKMGYTVGKGLGESETGRVNIVEASQERGRRGLGLRLKGLEGNSQAEWDGDAEEIMIRKEPEWMEECTVKSPLLNDMFEWMSMASPKKTIDDEFEFCEPNILKGILKSKSDIEVFGKDEFLDARRRSNPYETIKEGIFQNRAAMKMAEMDASFEFIFTSHESFDEKDTSQLLYFADICGGPGGFSEYILWRRKWRSKGFGFTLKSAWENDFKLNKFKAGTPETFDCHYGVGGYEGDGDIFRGDNLKEFSRYVKENSEGKGMHFVMADGGFSVEGQENIQEILSKQLYLCQFVCALSLLRCGGHFVCKLFDVFTPFSLGLVYLMYRAFKRISIFKPVTSRPANSERYIVCYSMREDYRPIQDYLFEINDKLKNLKESDVDIREVVPIYIMKDDSVFYEYMVRSNNAIGAKQILALKKLATYVQNVTLMGCDQGAVRRQCLEAWGVPVSTRSTPFKLNPSSQFESKLNSLTVKALAQDGKTLSKRDLEAMKCLYDYNFVLSGGERVILFSLGRNDVYKWNPAIHSIPDWKKVDKMVIELPCFTILDVEFVNEIKGDSRDQREVVAIHILDAIQLGEEYIGDRPLSDRIKLAKTFLKALSKPCCTEIVVFRMKDYHGLNKLGNILDGLVVKRMKPHMEPKLTLNLSEEKYFVPTGLYLIRKIKEPWQLQLSRRANRLYLYNPQTSRSAYDTPKDSIADVTYCTETRRFWKWAEGGIPDLSFLDTGNISRKEFLSFINSNMNM